MVNSRTFGKIVVWTLYVALLAITCASVVTPILARVLGR